jgi:class 3 adenylate cyclase
MPIGAARTATRGAPRALPGPALIAIAALIVLLRAVPHLVPFIGPWPLEPGDPVDFGFRFVAYVLWGAATLLALSHASTARLGWLLLAMTTVDAIWALQFIAIPALFFITEAFQGFSGILLAHILVSFPTGRLTSRFDRRLIAGLYLYFAGGVVVRLLTHQPAFSCDPDEYCPVNPFAVLANREVADAFGPVTSLLVPVIGLLVISAVLRHWRGAGPIGRQILLPVVITLPLEFVFNSIWYLSLGFDNVVLRELIELPFLNAIAWVLPVGFLIGVVRARAVRAALPGALVDLGSVPTTPQLQSVLRARLGDPTLQVVRWSRATGGYLDDDGRPVSEPTADGRRRLIALESEGEPIAAVIVDASLDDPGLEATITGLMRLTVEATNLRDELRAHGGDVDALPTGEVTFLFGDIEGSTALLESLGESYGTLLAEFRHTVSEVGDAHHGRVVDARADEVFLVFGSADDGVLAGIDLQRRIAAATWPNEASVRVRIGLHTGMPTLTPSGYLGVDVHRAARVMAAAHGGQILASASVIAALGAPSDVQLVSLGRFALRGLAEATPLVQVTAAGLTATFPAPRAEPAPIAPRPTE